MFWRKRLKRGRPRENASDAADLKLDITSYLTLEHLHGELIEIYQIRIHQFAKFLRNLFICFGKNN